MNALRLMFAVMFLHVFPTFATAELTILEIIDKAIADGQQTLYQTADEADLLLKTDPLETIRQLYQLSIDPAVQGKPLKSEQDMARAGIALQLARLNQLPGRYYWEALKTAIADPDTRAAAYGFIVSSGKSKDVYAPVDDADLPPGYAAAVFSLEPVPSLEAYQATQRPLGDYLHRLDVASSILEIYVHFNYRLDVEHADAYRDVVPRLKGLAEQAMDDLVHHDEWWARMYAVSVMGRCEVLRLQHWMEALRNDKDQRIRDAMSAF